MKDFVLIVGITGLLLIGVAIGGEFVNDVTAVIGGIVSGMVVVIGAYWEELRWKK